MQWYLVIIFVTVLVVVLLVFHALGFFKTEKKEKPLGKKTNHEEHPRVHLKQRLSSFIRDIKASPHYKIGFISLSLSLLILLVFLVVDFGNKDSRVKRRLEMIASKFEQQVNSHALEIEKSEPSDGELSIYEDRVMFNKLNTSIEIPEKPKAKWYRRKIFLTSISYDVRKTDSLVSPYIADIHFNCAVHGRVDGTKEAVESGEDSFTSDPTECISKYAFQEDHWVKNSVICKSYFTETWEPPTSKDGSIYQCSKLLPLSD
jgi:hypothetical protein